MKFQNLCHIIPALFLLAATGIGSSAPDARLTVSLDSAHLLMGKVTPLHISLTAPDDPEARLVIPKDSLDGKVEILEILKADTVNHGNGRLEINQDILLQSFDSGDYRLKPVLYVAGGDTIESNRLVLRVMPVMNDSIQLNDFADVSDVERKWYDYIPDFLYDYFWYIIMSLILFGGVVAAIIYYRGRKQPEQKISAPVLSPYEEAITGLTLLREKKLCEKGYEKQFYSDLTEILRIYLFRQFGINAMEMTSTEILRSLESNPMTRVPRHYMDRVLEIADFVKFAKVRPLPDDNVKAFDSAVKFVEDTKPVLTESDNTPDADENPTEPLNNKTE